LVKSAVFALWKAGHGSWEPAGGFHRWEPGGRRWRAGWPIKRKLHRARNEKRSGNGLVFLSSLLAGKLPPTASVHSPVGGLDRNLTVSLPKWWGCLTKAPSIKPLVRVGKVFGQVPREQHASNATFSASRRCSSSRTSCRESWRS